MKIHFLDFLIEEIEENARDTDEYSCDSKCKIKMNYVIVCWHLGERRTLIEGERERDAKCNHTEEKKTNHKKRKNERKTEKGKHQHYP